jgi:feruloyl esterase
MVHLKGLANAAILSQCAAFTYAGPVLHQHERRATPRCTTQVIQQALQGTNAVVELAASSFPNDPGSQYRVDQTGQKDICIIQVRTSAPGSNNPIRFGMMLPNVTRTGSNGWNGRILSYGNGAFAGGIFWHELVAGAWDGFAVMGTDTGHSGGAGDGSFGRNLNQALDWGYRSINVSLPLAQKVVKGYYQRTQDRAPSYYSSCSTGGRQGLRQLMADPNSFDGLLIGSPAWDWNRLFARAAQVADFNLQVSPPQRLENQTQFDLIIQQTLLKCDISGFDTSRDGIVRDVDACNTTMQNDANWNEISCEAINGGNPGPNCLTRTQRDIARKMATDGYLGNRLVYEGFTFPSARAWGTVLSAASTNPQTGFDFEYVKNFIGQDAGQQSWTWATNAKDIMDRSESDDQHRLNGARVDDFANIARSNAKIIIYHGTADGVIPVKGSRRLYNNMQNKGNLRYFEIPGMEHCWNAGAEALTLRAPWYIGGVGIPDATATSTLYSDARYVMPVSAGLNNTNNDALLAMVAWAEGGSAPAKLVATSFQNQYAKDSSWTAKNRTTTLCPYPQRANGDACVS